MQIGNVKEEDPREKRIAITPATAKRLVAAGLAVAFEPNLGALIGYSDSDFESAGARILDRHTVLNESDIIVSVGSRPTGEIPLLKKGSLHISFLDPFHSADQLPLFNQHNISTISMELIPRITRAQKMDALSSQANLAGYIAVIIAQRKLNKIFPMMMTAAGTISPAKVFVIGAGVAGLQAIATAKRLGARVDAFDTRPAVAEQVESLGAKFVKVDLGETGETKGGYAKQLTEEQLAKQLEVMAKHCAMADVVITTAQVFGRAAPRLITNAMIQQMKPGSVIVDMAVSSGGNVEGSERDKEVDINGVTIVGLGNLPGEVARDASQMYASNLMNLVLEFWDSASKTFNLDLENEIIQSALITHNGKTINDQLK